MEQDGGAAGATRAKLIETAVVLFAHKGYAAVSIRELAEAAGVNSALISYHFGGKENLYAAVLENQFATIWDGLAEVENQGLSPLERIRRYAQTVAEGHRLNPQLARLIFSEMTNPTNCFDTVVKKKIRGLFAFLYTAVADGIAQDEIRPDIHPGYAAISLAGIINFYFISRPMSQELLAPEPDHSTAGYVRQALEIYLNGVKK